MEKSFEKNSYAEGKKSEIEKLETIMAKLLDYAGKPKQIEEGWAGFDSKQRNRFVAEFYEKMGNQDKAKEAWERLVSSFELLGGNWEEKAALYEKIGQTEKAQEIYEEIIKENEKVFKGKEGDDAVEYIRGYINHTPLLYKETGKAYARLGNKLKAKEFLERAAKAYFQYLESIPRTQRKSKNTKLDQQELDNIQQIYNGAAETCKELAELIGE